MALSILNNIPSLAAQNQLAITGTALQRTLFRLSSGSRINSGADDAAGLAIADGLHANITALTQSSRNANDGVGALQVADGSLAQVTTLLNRAVTLATESATGTVSNAQRTALDSEFTAIKAEIDRIGTNTTFNGTAVFAATPTNIYLSDSTSSGASNIAVTTGILSSSLLGLTANAAGTLTAAANATAGKTITVGAMTYTYVNALSGAPTANEILIGANAATTLQNLAAAINGSSGAGTVYGAPTLANPAADAVATGNTMALVASNPGAVGNTVATTTNDANVTFGGVTLTNGGTGSATLTTALLAQAALTNINAAISAVAATRGQIGAAINRLQSAVNVMQNQSQNLSGAEDGIRAADIAQEVANMTKYSILNQTGISSLAQANQMQQSVLKLLQ
jgi:flagellin